MREIKFRGKRKDNGEWVYGDVHFNKDCSKGHIHERGQRVISFDIIPETVGQFTGLTDKHGKEIYEGDIVKQKIGIGDIRFDTENGRWSWNLCCDGKPLESIGRGFCAAEANSLFEQLEGFWLTYQRSVLKSSPLTLLKILIIYP